MEIIKIEEKIRIETFEEMEELTQTLRKIQKEYPQEEYALEHLYKKYQTFVKPGMEQKERFSMLIRAAVELTTQEAPKWEMIAARLLMLEFNREFEENRKKCQIHSFYENLKYLTNQGLYGAYILEAYSEEEVKRLSEFLDESRNDLFNYSGLSLLLGRYVIRTGKGVPMESPQEMFLGIAMHLAMKEKVERERWVRRFYDMLSELKVTMATPTLSNARKPYHQLSSCFIDTVPDSLDGIYRSIDNFAKVSKFGGGMGMYFGKVRASGSAIRGFEGAAGRCDQVDQTGERYRSGSGSAWGCAGAVAVYLDVWHRDLPEFLNLRTNNGDDRMKAHDVFPAVCYPDYFWQQARDHIEGDWYLMCPHEILTVKGYALEDCFGEEWTEKYLDCVQDKRIQKRVIPIKDVIRMIIRSAVETRNPVYI